MKICAYCDESRSLTREHVIPDWYCRTPGESDTFSARNPTTHVKGDLVVKDVCENCNGGVLSQLDAYGKALYDRHFSNFVYVGESVSLDVDSKMWFRWLLKLSYNSARAQDADTIVLSQFRNAMLGNEPLTNHVRCWAHLISSSYVDEQAGIARAATQLEASCEYEFQPAWFRITQMRLPYRPTSRVLQRQVIINSYAFTLLIAPLESDLPNEDLDKLASLVPVFIPDAIQFPLDAETLHLTHQTDHAANSVRALVENYGTRFEESPNAHVKKALDGNLEVLFLSVTPEIIDDGDVDSIADILLSMVATREMELAHRLRVGIMVSGYDDDPRPLWEIPLVRVFFRKLFLKCPFVFLLSHPDGGLLKLLAACWVFDDDDKSATAQETRSKEFFDRAFVGMNEVCYRLAISEENNRAISEIGIKACFNQPNKPS